MLIILKGLMSLTADSWLLFPVACDNMLFNLFFVYSHLATHRNYFVTQSDPVMVFRLDTNVRHSLCVGLTVPNHIPV